MIAAATDIALKQVTFVPNWTAIGACACIIVVTIMALLLIAKR